MSQIQTNLSARLIEGRQLARQKHRDGDAKKLGNLRAGNSGIMSDDGDVAGSCHRQAHLRALGLEIEEPDDSKLIMFQMGIANEDLIYADLKHTMAENEVVLREEEIPIEWFTSNGTKVTGRPDMVVCRRNDDPTKWVKGCEEAIEPIFGVEIKSIASVWTTRDVIGEQQPKMPHLIQAGHYAWKLGVPFRLLYKQYGIQEIPSFKGAGGAQGWGAKLFPKQGEPGSEHIDYEKGRVQPFEIVYELEFIKGILCYKRESTSKWTKTLVTEKDIERFYEFTSTMADKKELGPRPLTINAQGKEKNYSNCAYCPLQETCDKFESKGYDTWLKEVKKVVVK